MGFWNNPKRQNTTFWIIIAVVAVIVYLIVS